MTRLYQIVLLQISGIDANGFSPKVIRSSAENWWIALIMFLCFTMLVILRVFDSRRLTLLLNGFVRITNIGTLYREESSYGSRVSFMLLLNYLFVISFFGWSTASHYGYNWPGLPTIGLLMGGIALMYFVKVISTRMFGNIFELKDASREYEANIFLFNKVLGLALFPVVLLLAYARQIPSEYLIWTGVAVIGIMLIYRILRFILIGLGTSTVSFLYLILYLCTLELLPFVVIIKSFVVRFNTYHP